MEFKDKYDFKNSIRNVAINFAIDADLFDKIFGKVFTEIFEKEQQIYCILKKYNISLCQQIFLDIKTIKKAEKANFLILFEDYQKINNELSEIVFKVKKDCTNSSGKCIDPKECKIEIKQYPLFYSFVERKDLQEFHPDLIPTKIFLELIEQNMGKPGICFLYNKNKELLRIKKAANLGAKIIDSVWETNADGYVSIALTIKTDDIHLYEPYYILKDKPMLEMEIISECEDLSISLNPLEISEMVKIYENN